MTRTELAGLTTTIVGPAEASITVVLLHGFGAPGDDLVSLADTIDAPVRFVFPAAPLELAGIYGEARAWWMLDLARLEQELASGRPRDRRGEIPDGLAAARATVLRVLDQLEARFPPAGKLVLGGFSQGAMLALDVALHRERSLDGLILMSGTLVAEAEWAPRMMRVTGLPIVMSHGRHDQLLPFHVAEELRDRLRAAGARVDWHAFVGGHEIPPVVVDAIGAWLRTESGRTANRPDSTGPGR